MEWNDDEVMSHVIYVCINNNNKSLFSISKDQLHGPPH